MARSLFSRAVIRPSTRLTTIELTKSGTQSISRDGSLNQATSEPTNRRIPKSLKGIGFMITPYWPLAVFVAWLAGGQCGQFTRPPPQPTEKKDLEQKWQPTLMLGGVPGAGRSRNQPLKRGLSVSHGSAPCGAIGICAPLRDSDEIVDDAVRIFGVHFESTSTGFTDLQLVDVARAGV